MKHFPIDCNPTKLSFQPLYNILIVKGIKGKKIKILLVKSKEASCYGSGSLKANSLESGIN